MKEQFLSFLNSQNKPSDAVTNKLLFEISNKMESEKRVATIKFSASIFLAMGLSLLLCPQFGVGMETSFYHVGHFFLNNYGAWACALYCGLLYVSGASLLSVLVLTGNELLLVGKNTVYFFVSVTGLNFSFFMLAQKLNLANSELIHSTELSYYIIWPVGVLVFGQILFRLFTKIKLIILSGRNSYEAI